MSITNVITRITVDMAGDVKRFAVKAKQYDRATRVIVVSLLWDEVPYVLDSADTVRCNVHKPDGTIAIIEGDNIAVNGNTVTITLPGTALTAAGRAWADIEIETQDEGQQVSCQCFEIDIAKSPVDDDSIISTNEFSAMKLATKAANDAAAAATAEIEATAAAGTAASQAAAAAQAATDAANQAAAAATASIQIDPTLTDNSKAAPAGMVGEIKEDLSTLLEDKIGLTCNEWTPSAIISSTNYLQTTGYPSSQGRVYSASDSLKASGFIPLYGKMLEVPIIHTTDTTYPNYGLSLYDAERRPIYGRAISAEPNRSDTYIHWAHVYIPENAKYFRITYFADDTDAITGGHAPVFTYNLLREIPEAYKPITHELPVDTYMQNSIRRARQLTDIKWTPRVNIPRCSMINGSNVHFLDWFYANKEYTGIPYSGSGGDETTSRWTTPKEWGYAHNWVGACIPFEAFVTAARYPNSIFAETVNQESYNYNSSPYGIVCSALVNYAVNGPFPVRVINNFFGTSDKVYRYPLANNKISEIDANAIAIGDFLYTREHVIMITDIIRDVDGNVTHVEMSEATTVGNGNNTVLGSKLGGVARRKTWDYSDFKSRYGDYVKYRRTTFYGIPYVASMYVDTGDEGDKENIVDYPCIPYLGNGAIYRVGYIHNSKVCIGATGFTTLVVLKDGVLLNTFNITGLTEISVGFTDVGDYEAYLAMDAEGTSKTISCHWTVVSGTA